jgi:hypothetical protein
LIKRAQIDMPPRKQVMKFIENARVRKLTYKNRLHSLGRKISELAALCGVDILFVPGKPADDGSQNELITQFSEMQQHKIREKLNIRTYLEGELNKKVRKLVKVKQCRLEDYLTMSDPQLYNLPFDGLMAMHQAMNETLEKGSRRTAKLGIVDVVATSATVPALEHARALPCNAFDLNLSDTGSSEATQDDYLPPDVLPPPALKHAAAFDLNLSDTGSSIGAHDHYYVPPDMLPPPALQQAAAFSGKFDLNLLDAGSSIGAQDRYNLPTALQHAPAFPGNSIGAQDHYYLPRDILPQPPFPVQPSYIGLQRQMQPPYITFGGAPMPFMPFPMAAPPGFSFTGGAMNIRDGQPAGTPAFAMQGPGQGFAAGEAVAYHQELQPAGAAVAYHQDFLAYGYDPAGAGAGAHSYDAAGYGGRYEHEPPAAGVWPLGTLSNPVGTAAYELPDNGVRHHALGEQEKRRRMRLFDQWM